MYQEKYDEFQQTLTKSNDVFQNFKNEMDKVIEVSLNIVHLVSILLCVMDQVVGFLLHASGCNLKIVIVNIPICNDIKLIVGETVRLYSEESIIYNGK